MTERAFPVIYASDVARSVAFYELLGFEVHFRLPPEGDAGYVGLRRGRSELGIVTAASPRDLAGVEPGAGPCFELFVYVADPDRLAGELGAAGGRVLREPVDMPWGERVGFVADPDGNPVSLARAI